jgi:hypothetical protein
MKARQSTAQGRSLGFAVNDKDFCALKARHLEKEWQAFSPRDRAWGGFSRRSAPG